MKKKKNTANFGILAHLSTGWCIVKIVSETLGDFPIHLISVKNTIEIKITFVVIDSA